MDESQRVMDHFAAAGRDWPCPAFADRVLYVPVEHDAEVTRSCPLVLSNYEVERADRFVTERGRENFIQRRAYRRYCAAAATGVHISDAVFVETANGRPYLPACPELWFSFSSCRGGFIGAWSATHAIGVDIEDHAIALDATDLAESYFTPTEARMIANEPAGRHQLFLQLWSLKEAALKSIGEGLPFGLDKFGFEIDESVRVTDAPESYGGPANFMPHLFDLASVHASIVGRSPSC